jgi:hypothetical protein
MLAACLLQRHAPEARWTALYRAGAARLWSQREWSAAHECHYWTQDLYGRRSTYLGAVHGFVATAAVIIRGRDLLEPAAWDAWQASIENTVQRTAAREDSGINWPPQLEPRDRRPLLMQICHGAPGFVVALADMPGHALDADLLAAGEAIWAAGPLRKGASLCHGSGGNGLAFLALHARTGDARWLERARAFAMHGIAQVEAHRRAHGQGRYSLWTGDPGFALYLLDCIDGAWRGFPTLQRALPASPAST